MLVRLLLVRFNRTFMELKYDILLGEAHDMEVLIVPLWN